MALLGTITCRDARTIVSKAGRRRILWRRSRRRVADKQAEAQRTLKLQERLHGREDRECSARVYGARERPEVAAAVEGK
jgi:hypothetical protein